MPHKMKVSHRFSLVATGLLLLAWMGGTADNQGGGTADANDDSDGAAPATTPLQKTRLSELFAVACTETKLAKCSMAELAFDDATRTVSAGRHIIGRRLLVGIPNDLQIVPLDALRDPRIRKIFERRPDRGREGDGYKPPSSAAYLALYLVLEARRFRDSAGGSDSPKDKVHRAYFSYLPTLEDFLEYHPVAKRVLGENSDEIQEEEHRQMPYTPFVDQSTEATSRTLIDEYKAFSEASDDFVELSVSLEDFVWGILIVGTRVFHNLAVSEDDDIDEEEMKRILPHLADKSLDSAMRPLIDAFNDHNQRNLGWIDGWKGKEGGEKPHAVIFSRDSITPGTELFLNYVENKADFHKLSQYGFINTDGSEHSTASLALYHRPLLKQLENDYEEETTKNQSLRYLSFLDGYQECPSPGVDDDETSIDSSFRRVQLEALRKILYNHGFWGVTIPASSLSTGEELSGVPDALIMTTCRLLALTHRDYNGAAAKLLELQLVTGTFDGIVLAPMEGADALEYRAYHVLERLATEVITALMEALAPLTSPHASDVETDVWRRLEEKQLDPASPEGLRAYVLLRELESLRKVMALARKQKVVYLERKHEKTDSGEDIMEEDYVVRMESCPNQPQQTR